MGKSFSGLISFQYRIVADKLKKNVTATAIPAPSVTEKKNGNTIIMTMQEPNPVTPCTIPATKAASTITTYIIQSSSIGKSYFIVSTAPANTLTVDRTINVNANSKDINIFIVYSFLISPSVWRHLNKEYRHL